MTLSTVLFPPDLPKARWLEYVIAEFGGIELNYSFYAGRQCWDSCAIFKSWRRRLPRGSSVTVKAPRELTHGYTSGQYRPNVALTAARRDEWLPKLLRGARKLGSKMGVMLLQFSSCGCTLSRTADGVQLVQEDRHDPS